MVKITFELDENLNEKFRRKIATSKGLYRGAIQEALIEAIILWNKSNMQRNEKVKKSTTQKEINKP
jgi:hypothetical protein